MKEVWKEAPRWPEYEVSNHGRVRRASPSPSAKGAHAKIGRILSQHKNRGYLCVRLKRPGYGRTEKVHRLVCEAFHGPAPSNDMEVNHKDSDRGNPAASNLEWVTRKDNLAHSRVSGNGCRKGARNPMAKLDERMVMAIRSDDRTQRIIAEEYGISQSLVSAVKLKKAWGHI